MYSKFASKIQTCRVSTNHQLERRCKVDYDVRAPYHTVREEPFIFVQIELLSNVSSSLAPWTFIAAEYLVSTDY